MNKFSVQNPDQSVEEIESAHESLEGFVNERFGSAYAAFCERGGSVALIDEPLTFDPEIDEPLTFDPEIDEKLKAEAKAAEAKAAEETHRPKPKAAAPTERRR
jgi:hypothetical protein